MATAAQVDRFRRSQDEVERLIRRDMRRIWTSVGRLDPSEVRDELLRLSPLLSAEYGAASAAMAAEWFEDIARAPARVGATASSEAVRGSVRYAAAGLFDGTREDAFERISQAVTRHSLQGGRNTIVASAGRNRMRYARAPESGACAWCMMLASRGAVYHTRQTAGAEGNKFHDQCRCCIEPANSDAELSYDAKALYEKYEPAHAYLDRDRDVTRKMRQLYGLK